MGKWKTNIEKGQLFVKDGKEFLDYNYGEWEKQKTEQFHSNEQSSESTNLDVYKFHQAADYHRHYTLKHLLPKHGLIVN